MEARAGFFLVGRFLDAGFFFGAAFRPLEEALRDADVRDAVRREEGEVFVAIAHKHDGLRRRCNHPQTSITTGRITGLRCVASLK